jgi:hypothetical protein
MATASVTVHIDKPVREVFTYMANYNNNVEWQDSVIASRQDTPGEPGTGTRVSYERKIAGRTVTSNVEMTAFETNAKIRIKTLKEKPFKYSGGYDFSIVAGGTQVAYHGTIEITSRLLGFAGRLLAKGFQNQMEKDLANLKRILEER